MIAIIILILCFVVQKHDKAILDSTPGHSDAALARKIVRAHSLQSLIVHAMKILELSLPTR